MLAGAAESEDRILERDRELAVIEAALAGAVRGEGSLVLVDGPAGVGKTTLMLAARDAAGEEGLLLLRARGSELERPFGFGVIRQLFDPVVQGEHGAKLLNGSARFAASVLDVDQSSPPQDPFSTRNSIYWLTANLASRQPVLMLVDDAHWADDASLEVLAHLANRLHGIPVALILAARSEASWAPLELLRRTVAELGSLLHPSPLGEEAAITLIRSFAPEADEALCRACFEASGGNPFLLRELARSLITSDGSGDPRAVLDQSPQRVTRDIASRLERLPASATELAHAAAVLGDGAPLRRGAALAGLYEDDVTEAADALVAGGVLRSTSPLEFLHPLVRAGVYAGMGPASRSIEHWRAAKMLASEGEGPERVASQLLLCEPSGERWSVEQLQRAAALAMARGAPDTATTLLRRALAEPPAAEDRSRVLLDLGTAEAMALDLEASVEHMREACHEGLDPADRFQGAMLLAGMLGHAYRFAEAVDVLEAQLDALAGHPELVRQLEVALTNITRVDPETRPRTERLRAEIARRVDAGEDDDPATIGTQGDRAAPWPGSRWSGRSSWRRGPWR